MADLTMEEFRRVLMDLATALSEPGRRFSLDQVMQKGHEFTSGRTWSAQRTPSTLLFTAVMVRIAF